MKFVKKFFLLTLLTPLECYPQPYVIYTVRKAEYLSTILYSLDYKPIYGDAGTISQTINLNPELRKSRGNRLLPGQTIRLPMRSAAFQSVTTLIQKSDEAKIKSSERFPNEDVSDYAAASISVAGGIDFFKIEGVDEATGDSSTILSEASPSVLIGYSLFWDERMTFSFNAKVQKYKLQDLIGDDQSFDDGDGTKVDLSFRILRKYSERLFLGGGFGFEEDLFFHAVTATELGVDKVMIAKPDLYVLYNAFEKSNANIGFDAKLGANLSEKTNAYNIKNGIHYGVGTYFKYHSKSFDQNYKSLQSKVFYSIDEQNTSVSTRKLTNLAFMIFYDWRLPW